ncbi:hypothetical protein HIM_05785 [Hirsutella minnesotensis 3608]|uniref:ABC transporter domain-containing protein n=1 Tax=Hirsutella minnesotensis 3608 TaxID=1043627 RepID=A0A0F7ZK16_9HYPO|nr:hypothetical protein HIM_05785 [Hirsutella minnesotensis 3608]
MSFLRCDALHVGGTAITSTIHCDMLSLALPIVVTLLSLSWLACSLARGSRPLRGSASAGDAMRPLLTGRRRLSYVAHNHMTERESDARSTVTTSTWRKLATKGPLLSMFLETLALAMDLGLTITSGVSASPNHLQDNTRAASFTNGIPSAYALCLVLARIYIGSASPRLSTLLRRHSALMYGLQWTLAMGNGLFADQDNRSFNIQLWPLRIAIFSLVLFVCLTSATLWATSMSVDSTDNSFPDTMSDANTSFATRVSFRRSAGLIWSLFVMDLESLRSWEFSDGHKAENLVFSFSQILANSLFTRLCLLLKRHIISQGLWACMACATLFVPIILLHDIIRHLESPDPVSSNRSWLLIAGLLISGLLSSLINTQCEWSGRKVGVKMKTILLCEIHAKVLRCRGAAELMTADVDMVSEFCARLHVLWMNAPAQALVASWVLYSIVGASGVVGVVCMIALQPLRLLISDLHAAALQQVLEAASRRSETALELLAGVRHIKYCSLEAYSQRRVEEPRRVELRKLHSRFAWWSIYTAVNSCIPIAATVVTLAVHVGTGHRLRSSTIFPVMATFNALRPCLYEAADLKSRTSQALFAFRKIETFLTETESDALTSDNDTVGDEVGFESATLQWPCNVPVAAEVDEADPLLQLQPLPSFQLSDIDTSFRRNCLNVIFGHPGSGKSSLLQALLGEMHPISGRINIVAERSGQMMDCAEDPFKLRKTVAFCPREPWIQNLTIRENITLGMPFDRARYKMALEAAAFLWELPGLPRGDLSLAGDNGVNLSPTHRQRISIARALYSPAQCVLLDDCLDGLDQVTARHILAQGIRGPLMEGRTCVFATRQIRLVVPYCAKVVYIDNGRIRCQGRPERLIAARILSSDIMTGVTFASTGQHNGGSQRDGDSDSGVPIFKNFSKAPTLKERDFPNTLEVEADPEPGPGSWSAVGLYLMSMGSRVFPIFVFCAILARQLALLGLLWWFKDWASRASGSIDLHRDNAAYNAAICSLVVVVFVSAHSFHDALALHGALNAAKSIHNRLLAAVFHAKVNFFDCTTIDQIAVRLSRDTRAADQDLATSVSGAFQRLSYLTVVVVLVTAVSPTFILIVIPLALGYAAIGINHCRLGHHLDRCAAKDRLLLKQHTKELLSGVISIRAYGLVAKNTREGYWVVNRDCRNSLFHHAAEAWWMCRVRSLGAITSTIIGLLAVREKDNLRVSVGTAALALAWSMSLSEDVLSLHRFCVQAKAAVHSVRRVKEWIDTEQEPVEPIKEARPPTYSWPQRGTVRFRNFFSRYKPDDAYALKNIDILIGGRQRVAIVGYRGAGKTSLAMAIIRRLEATQGSIELDGVNIASLRLQQLRQLVTVIPTDPSEALFSQTVRHALDPLVCHDDEQIFEVMQRLSLARFVPIDLDSSMPSLTAKQRQVLCLARAILSGSLVIIVDDASDSPAEEADDIFHMALRNHIAGNTTVVTLTSRLPLIADYNRVVVMSAGDVIEEGVPWHLLMKDEKTDPSAAFKRMCIQSGQLRLIERIATLRA